MLENTRAAVAYIAGRIISGKKVGHVYDYSVSRHISIDGNITVNDKVDVYDYESKANISGNHQGSGKYNLYHYGNRHHIELKVTNNKFEGYDYGERCHFSGDVNGSGSVSLYDYGDRQHYNYSV